MAEDAPMIPLGEGSGANDAAATAPTASQTEIKVEKVTHNWTVKNFSHCYQEYLENFVHLNKGEETLTWSVKIYPKGNGENNKDFVFLCLNRVQPSAPGPVPPGKLGKIGFKSRFIMKTAESKDIEMRVHPNPSHSDYVSYIKRDVLFPQILPSDIIVVSVEIDVAVETVTTSDGDGFPSPDSDQQLISDYGNLLKEGDSFSDFVIRVQSHELKVHRPILAARSSVFHAMLMHETEEAKKGFMDIKDLELDVVQEMLSFVYCGRTSRLSEIGADLLVAADKYSLADLKLHCEKALIGALSVENACELLILSDVHSARRLRDRAVDFILQHSFHVTSTPGWSLMLSTHPALVTEIVTRFTKPPPPALTSPFTPAKDP